MKKRIFVLKNSIFKDHRGYYWTTWTKKNFKKLKFNHDKFSISKKNVLRGFHCDSRSWKLVTCVYGKWDVMINRGSYFNRDPDINAICNEYWMFLVSWFQPLWYSCWIRPLEHFTELDIVFFFNCLLDSGTVQCCL